MGEYLNDVIEIDNIDNVFDIANSLYESELVEFSHLNFFACIQFHDLYYTYQYNLHNNYHYDSEINILLVEFEDRLTISEITIEENIDF